MIKIDAHIALFNAKSIHITHQPVFSMIIINV